MIVEAYVGWLVDNQYVFQDRVAERSCHDITEGTLSGHSLFGKYSSHNDDGDELWHRTVRLSDE
jgi:hypothetical protein